MRRALLILAWAAWPLIFSSCRTGGPSSTEPTSPAAVMTQEEAGPESQPSSASEPRGLELDDLLPRDPAVRYGRLDNGLTYYIRENGRPENRAELRLAVDAGSILEDDDQLGLAHFAEHMAFNGTENFAKQELIDYLESIGMRFGADINAYTSFDETVYMLQVPTDDDEIVEQGFQILEDWAGGVTFEGEEIDKERGVVIEEWRIGRGAGARIREKQFPILFAGSLYAERVPIGTKEILETFEHDTLRRFYRDWYRPDLMAVVAVGDFEADEIEGLVHRHFSGLENPDEPRSRALAEVPDREEAAVSVVTDPELPSSSVSVAYLYDPQPQDRVRDYRRSLVESLFHSVLNARLAERAREPDPPFLGAGSSQGAFIRAKGVYSLGAGVEEGGLVRGLEALLMEAERARRHGFGEAELERQKADYLRFLEQAYEERDKTGSRIYAAEYVRNFLEGEPFPGIAYELELTRRYLPTIGVEELDELAQEWIGGNHVVLATAPEKEGLEPPAETELAGLFEAVRSRDIEPWVDEVSDRPLVADLPTPGRIAERRYDEELDIHVWTLENGATVILKPTDFKNDQVTFTAFSPGGHSLVPDEDWVAGATAASVVSQGGLGEFDLVALDKRLSGTVARVSPFIAELSEGLSGGGSPQDLETLFQLLHLTFTAPRKDEEAFTSYQTRMKAVVRNQRAMPEVVFSEAVTEVLTQGHPRRHPFDEELLDRMDLDRSFEIYRERFADTSDFTFIFVGNLNVEAMESLVETYVGSLPGIDRQESWRDVGVRPPDEVVKRVVQKGLEPKSRFRLVFTGPFEQRIENRYLQASLEDLLRTRLRERLREEMGGTYSVGVSASSSHEPIDAYSFSISFSCDPEKVPELRAAVFEEIERLKTSPATDEEVATIQEKQRRQRETALKENSFWLGSLRYAFYHDEDPHQILTYDDRVAGLTSAALEEAARRYFDLERYVQVVLMPESQAQPPAGL